MNTKHSNYAFSTVIVTVVVLLAPVSAKADGLTGLTPAQEYQGSIEKVRELLAPHRSFADLSAFVGNMPTRCQGVPRGASICVWSLSNRERGWQPLAGALKTGDRLKLVCELPPDEAPREKDSCSVHAQRSNRAYYRGTTNASDRMGRPSRWSSGKEAELSTEATQLIADARTAFELSTLVGDAPSECRAQGARVLCTWRGTSGTYGHGTLAMSIGVDMSKKVRLQCVLPADGTPRAPDSCRVEIGD